MRRLGSQGEFARFEHPSFVTLLRGKCRSELIIIKRKGEIETVSSRGITQSELSTSANGRWYRSRGAARSVIDIGFADPSPVARKRFEIELAGIQIADSQLERFRR